MIKNLKIFCIFFLKILYKIYISKFIILQNTIRDLFIIVNSNNLFFITKKYYYEIFLKIYIKVI